MQKRIMIRCSNSTPNGGQSAVRLLRLGFFCAYHTFIVNRIKVFVVSHAIQSRVHLLAGASVVFGAAAVGGEVYAGEGPVSPAAGASWPIKISLVTDPNSIHVVEVAVGQSAESGEV